VKFENLSSSVLPERARRLVLVSLCLASLAGVVSAKEPTKPAPRPVARLLSTSRTLEPARPQTRVISTSYRAEPRLAPAPRASTAAVSAATMSERRLLELVNAERRARGRRPLSWDGELTRMARYHSENMARQGFFNHVDRSGRDLQGRALLLGIRNWGELAENIAYNQGYDDPEAFAVERWMISSKHRENILNGEFTHAGLGVARGSDGRLYFTQVFMRR
jgi:uncharacterized protein YkwD